MPAWRCFHSWPEQTPSHRGEGPRSLRHHPAPRHFTRARGRLHADQSGYQSQWGSDHRLPLTTTLNVRSCRKSRMRVPSELDTRGVVSMAHFTTNPVTGSSPRAGFVVYRTGEAGESTPGGGSQDAPRDHERQTRLGKPCPPRRVHDLCAGVSAVDQGRTIRPPGGHLSFSSPAHPRAAPLGGGLFLRGRGVEVATSLASPTQKVSQQVAGWP